MNVLAAAGFPLALRRLAEASWVGSCVVDGEGARSYDVARGVGQGCSAAALLFVIGMEPLLIEIAKSLDSSRHEVLSVFADDVAFATAGVSRLLAMQPLFDKFERCASLSLGVPKCCVIPLASGSQAAAVASVSASLCGSPWAAFAGVTEAVLIGVSLGPTAALKAWGKPFDKCKQRILEVSGSGRSTAQGLVLARSLAWPVLGYVAQLLPAPRDAARTSKLFVQRLLHLPHHGLPPLLLRSLGTVGIVDIIPIDLYITATRVLAAVRLAPDAVRLRALLRGVAERSELCPLGSLTSGGRLPADFVLRPLGWDGGALVSSVCEAKRMLGALPVFSEQAKQGLVAEHIAGCPRSRTPSWR